MSNNLWGYMIDGFTAITVVLFGTFPVHHTIGLANLMNYVMGSAPVMLYVFINQFINLAIPMLLFGIILILEIIRGVIAIWMWIKNAIPIAG